MTRYILGITGAKRAGKDSVARCLLGSFYGPPQLAHGQDFKRYGLADPLKMACCVLFGLSHDQLYGDKKEEVDPRWNASPREIMQWVGTECLRQRFGDLMHLNGRWPKHQTSDFWLKVAQAQLPAIAPSHVIISDIRYENEARWVLAQQGGRLIKVTRPGTGAGDDHISERGLDLEALGREYPGAVAYVHNNSDLEALRRCVLKVLKGDLGIPLVGA